MSRKILIFISLCIAGIFVACSPAEETALDASWEYVDLRILSTYGNTKPESDLIAAYTRFAGSDLQIRLDLLDLTFESDADIYIALDTGPGGTPLLPITDTADIEWDTLLVIPASGNPKALTPGSQDTDLYEQTIHPDFEIRHDLTPRVVRLPWQDYILVSVNRTTLPESPLGFSLQAFTTSKDSEFVEDKLGPFGSHALPPSPAPVVLAFWNTFPAYTPAQALRRWDGAHTGPFGERHGLSILLENVQKNSVPVVLLDLREPAALSALDYSGALHLIQELISEKLLVLPDLLPGSPTFALFPKGLSDGAPDQYLQNLKEVSNNFDLSSSNILYSPLQLGDINENYVLTFTNQEGIVAGSIQGNRFLPLPPEKTTNPQATPEGLSLAIRKLLLDNALQLNYESGESPLLILGGSLVDSSFADPPSSAGTLSYIANHPWIQALNGDDLRSLPLDTASQVLPGNSTSIHGDTFTPSEILLNLPNPSLQPQNPLYQVVWDSVFSLYAPLPPESPELPSLRSNYTGQPGIALEAALWAENPQSRQDCLSDPDLDGLPECILASDRHFTIFDFEGARLLAYYYLSETGIHQIIAPTSQFIVGLADPSTWLLGAGEGSDTAGVHGAFADRSPPWDLFNVSISENALTFTSLDQQFSKRFSLSSKGLRIDYFNPDSSVVKIPLTIDPWMRFSLNWSDNYHGQLIQDGYKLQLDDSLSVEIHSDSPISAHIFSDSQARMAIPEDPNFDYPQGHYLPFPLAIIEVSSREDFYVEFDIHP